MIKSTFIFLYINIYKKYNLKNYFSIFFLIGVSDREDNGLFRKKNSAITLTRFVFFNNQIWNVKSFLFS